MGTNSAQANTPIVLVAGVAKRVLSNNRERSFAILQNDDPNNTIYVNLGMGAALSQGVRLNPGGGSMWLGNDTDFPYTGEVWAISQLGATILVTEVGT